MDAPGYSSSTILTAVACLGAVCAGLYVVWGPEHFFRRKGQCPGLVNLGNTCFMNAVLQGLAALPPVKEWLRRVSESQNGPLSSALNEVLAVLTEEREGVHSPSSLLRALRHHRWSIDFQQQDAHELYHVILTTLSEEIIPCPSLLTDLSPLLQEGGGAETIWTRGGSVKAPEKLLKCPLQGLLTSELLCCTCHYSFPLLYETFDSLSLSLPAAQSHCTLQGCLLDYVKSEMVQEVVCPQCSKAVGKETKQTFLKKLQLGRAPDCLCIHFKRTIWLKDGQLKKTSSYVSYPLRLDTRRFLRTQGKKSGYMYTLCAVTEHLGGPFSGHYQTYRRGGGSGRQWACTSDTAVYSASIHDVLKANAYMLYYSREQ